MYLVDDKTRDSDMDMLTLSRLRCSVRDYVSRNVEKEKLEYILEAARLAPSAVNFQPWFFVVIKGEEGCNHIRQCYDREWFRSAPMYILVCADHRSSWVRKSDGKDHADIDVAIATEHICLAAAEKELGTCWVCNFDTDLCKQLFNLPSGVEPVVIVPIGYPKEPEVFVSTPKRRKAFNEIVKWESF